MYCRKCGAPIKEENRFCEECGTPIRKEEKSIDTEKSKQFCGFGAANKKIIAVILGAFVLIVVIVCVGLFTGEHSTISSFTKTGDKDSNSIKNSEELKPYFEAKNSSNQSSYNIGDNFTLGNMDELYIDWVWNEAGNEKTGTRHYKNTDIEWTILDIEGSCATAISTYVLDEMDFEENFDVEKATRLSWKNCTLRSWLNNEFYSNVFTESEKEAILSTYVKNGKSSICDSIKGPTTIDKVYILSMDEAYQYYPSDIDRAELVKTRGDAGDTLNYALFRTVTPESSGSGAREASGLFMYKSGSSEALTEETLSPYVKAGISPVISINLNEL